MHDGHRERVRKKFLTNNLSGFAEHEILELLLFYAIPRKNTNEIAHKLINEFGTLSKVLDASITRLQTIDGIGESAAVFLKMIPEVCKIYLESKNKPRTVKNSSIDECYKMLKNKFIGISEEAVGVMLFDMKGNIVYNGIINKGSINAVDVYMRKIIELVLMYHAYSIILAHNHTSGTTLPSKDDINSTKKLNKIFKGLKINFLDHLIIGYDDYNSMRYSGMEDVFE